jgi:hypothetical protein
MLRQPGSQSMVHLPLAEGCASAAAQSAAGRPQVPSPLPPSVSALQSSSLPQLAVQAAALLLDSPCCSQKDAFPLPLSQPQDDRRCRPRRVVTPPPRYPY